MKRPIVLKTVLDIFFILLIIKIVLGVGINIFRYFIGEPIVFFGNGQEFGEINGDTAIPVAAHLCIQFLMVFFILKLKQLVRRFLKGEIFSPNQTKDLRIAGKALLGIAALDIGSILVYLLLTSEPPGRAYYEHGEFGSHWYILALGLFFIFLSKVFDNARILKEENELTV